MRARNAPNEDGQKPKSETRAEPTRNHGLCDSGSVMLGGSDEAIHHREERERNEKRFVVTDEPYDGRLIELEISIQNAQFASNESRYLHSD